MALWLTLAGIFLVFVAIAALFWRSTRTPQSGNNPEAYGLNNITGGGAPH